MLVTVINYIIPFLLGMITEIEGWAFASTRLMHEVWRTYLAGILNNIIFALVYAEVILNTAFFRDKPLTDYNTANSKSVRFPCREDMAAIAFIKLVIF